jgi:WD40 repeat protein
MPAGTLKQTLAEQAYSFCLTFSPDGRSLAQGGNNGNVYIWDTATGALRQTFSGISLWSIAFSPDGRLMFGGAEKSVKILDGQTGALKQTLSVAGDKVQSVGLSPDGRLLVSADKDIKFWERAP